MRLLFAYPRASGNPEITGSIPKTLDRRLRGDKRMRTVEQFLSNNSLHDIDRAAQ
jgi:hypothetical protein